MVSHRQVDYVQNPGINPTFLNLCRTENRNSYLLLHPAEDQFTEQAVANWLCACVEMRVEYLPKLWVMLAWKTHREWAFLPL